jgi:hypothetical protein
MIMLKPVKLSLLAGAGLMLFATSGCSDESLKFSNLPPKVRESAQTYARGIKPPAFSAEKKGKSIYEIAYMAGAQNIELIIKEDGTLESIEESLTYMPPQNSALNDEIDTVASLMEDAVEAAIVDDRETVGTKFAEFERDLPALKVSITKDRFALIEKVFSTTKQAFENNETLQSALSAVEIYRLLVSAIDYKNMEVPLQVSLLDYSGFKLSTLSANPKPDWPEIQTTTVEAIKFWSAIEQDVKNAGLHDLMQSLFEGLASAVTRRDPVMLEFGAQMDLDAVDLLEGYYRNAWKENNGVLIANEDG